MELIHCMLEELIDWHSHAIVIGRVRAVRVSGGPGPLTLARHIVPDIRRAFGALPAMAGARSTGSQG